ncbi:GspH/FimT family pseudopilin [Marinimicrobium agarilyticum]|uniref:GspH/FimT family pseudopilin n=1 Tax=Marinimicrobium agarilyticum TaxID=306546 RepID=UPI00041EE427|nr:GspH/FimT family pseudopilin [Marinimicrobium agarilyticum]
MRHMSFTFSKGFTLIELMVTVAVLAIILSVAVPSMTTQIRNNRSLTFGEEFATALNYARSEAVKRGRPVSLCASNDAGDGCGNDWTNGWLAFVDSDPGGETGSNPTIADANTDILRYWSLEGDGLVLDVVRGGVASGFVRYVGMGTLARVDNVANPITALAQYENCVGEAARQVSVGLSGSVHLSRTDC